MERAVATKSAAAADEGERADAKAAATTEQRRAGLTNAAVEEVAQRFGQQQLGTVVGEARRTAANVVASTTGREHTLPSVSVAASAVASLSAAVSPVERPDMALLQAAEILNMSCEIQRRNPRLEAQRNNVVHVYDSAGASNERARMQLPDAVDLTERVVRKEATELRLQNVMQSEKVLALEHAAVPLALLSLTFSCYWPHANADYVIRSASDPAGLANMAVRGTVEVDAPAIRAVCETLSPPLSASDLAHNERLQQVRRTTQAFNRWKHLYLDGVGPRCLNNLVERHVHAAFDKQACISDTERRHVLEYVRRGNVWKTANVDNFLKLVQKQSWCPHFTKDLDLDEQKAFWHRWYTRYTISEPIPALNSLVEGENPSEAPRGLDWEEHDERMSEKYKDRKSNWRKFEAAGFDNFDDAKRTAVVQFLEKRTWYPNNITMLFPDVDGATTTVQTVFQTIGEHLQQRPGVSLATVQSQVQTFLRSYGQLALGACDVVKAGSTRRALHDDALRCFMTETLPRLVTAASSVSTQSIEGGHRADHESAIFGGRDADL